MPLPLKLNRFKIGLFFICLFQIFTNKGFALNQPQVGEYFSYHPLGIGGDQHYPDSDRRFFTNIVDVDAGDLDGDGIDDIVLLANVVPNNGAYSTITNQFNKFGFNSFDYSATPFLTPADYLYNAASRTTQFNNPPDSTFNWIRALSFTRHYAPPSPNIVAGMLNNYTGSDVAWLRSDGRGHFELRFVTVNNASGNQTPVRIVLGRQIQLVRLAGSSRQDILLISAPDDPRTTPNDATSIEPFSGTNRVFWLENRGWNTGNTDLVFTDHGIAEWMYDKKRETAFYRFFSGGSRNTDFTMSGVPAGTWEGEWPTLGATTALVRDIDNDGRNDVLIGNINGNARVNKVAASDPFYTYKGNNPDKSDLTNALDTTRLPLPSNGDRWVNCPGGWNSAGDPYPGLIWYKDINSSGLPNFNTETSTRTYHPALFDDGSEFDVQWVMGSYPRKVFFIRLKNLHEAVIMNHEFSVNPSYIYRRITSVSDNLVLSKTPVLTPFGSNHGIFVADLDGNGDDEIFTITEDNGVSHVYNVKASGADSVTVTKVFDAVWGGSGHMGMAIDVDQNGRNDMILFPDNLGGGSHVGYFPFSIFFNNSTPGNFDFTLRRQKYSSNQDWNWGSESPYSNVLYRTGHIAFSFARGDVASGDFNNDGFPDIVRVGPRSPVAVYLNKWSTLPRARVRATVTQGTGKASASKTWSAVFNGQLIGSNVRISTTPVGGIAPAPSQWMLSE